MKKSWDTIDRYVIISADTHAGADLLQYKQYLDKEWHAEFDAWAPTYTSPYDDLVAATANLNWDSDLRLKALEEDGIVAEIVFPNTIPPFFNTIHSMATLPSSKEQFERRVAGLTAHNRWLVEFCGFEPQRRRGVLQVFPHDVDLAVRQIRAAKETGVICGILLPAVPANHTVEPYFHPKYEPIWAVCEELDLPIHQHPGTGTPEVGFDQPAGNAVMLTEMLIWTERTLPHLVYAGVFERHPNLKVVWTEQSDLSWVRRSLLAMDGAVAAMKSSATNRTATLFGDNVIESLSMAPSEYFARNVYIGASFMPRYDLPHAYEFGLDRIMWGADFPHEEGTTPYSREALRSTFFDVPESDVRMVLAGTAAGVYGFDLDALTPVAERVGPTVAEVKVPLEVAPPSHSLAFAAMFSNA